MKTIISIVINIIFSLVLIILPFISYADGLERYIVTIKGPAPQAIEAVERSGGKVNHTFSIIPAIAISIPPVALPALQRNPLIIGIEPDIIVSAIGKQPQPSQPSQSIDWGVNRIDADLAWSVSKGAGIKVGVIDTGIDKDHPDLVANIKGGVNFVFKKGQVNPDMWDDDNGHGTHVSGIIGAVDNSIGIIGVAPSVSLYGIKVLDRNGNGYLSDVIAGIDWAVNNGMDIVNMSLGTNTYITSFENACNAAFASGVILVAAAGNDGTTGGYSTVDYPAAFASVIAVAATDINNTRPLWSSYGPEVEFSAPGVVILSTWSGGGYKTLSGTSMSSPHVAGVAALALTQPVQPAYDYNLNGIWDVAELRTWLQNTADYLGPNIYYGYGLIDAEEATTGIQTNP